MNEIKYYGHEECEIIADLGDEYLISLWFLYYGECGGEYGEEKRLVVKKQYVFDERPVLPEIIVDIKKEENRIKEQIDKDKRAAEKEIYNLKRDTDDEIKEFKKTIKELESKIERYKKYSIYIDVIENSGRYQYVVLKQNYGGLRVETIDEFIRSLKDREITIHSYVSSYGELDYRILSEETDHDGYRGDRKLVIPCENIDVVKKHCIDQLEKSNRLNDTDVKLINKYDLTSKKIEEKLKQKTEDEKKTIAGRRVKLLEELKALDEKDIK